MYGMPRGVLNNNPFNIKISGIAWKNKIVPSRDKSFEQFLTWRDGIHAGATNLLNYYLIHRLQTVTGIISRFAPPSENDTAAYIAAVSKYLGVDPNDKIDLFGCRVLADLIEAIVLHENGEQPYPDTIIAQIADDVLSEHHVA